MPAENSTTDYSSSRRERSANLVATLAMLIILQLGVAPVRAAPPSGEPNRSGEQLYTQYCAKCHSNAHAVRVPQLSVLRAMGPAAVLDALEFGPMRFTGLARTADERHAIVEFVTGKKIGQETEAKESLTGRCADAPGNFDPNAGPKWNGWGNDLSNTRFQSDAAAGLTADQVSKLQVKWAFGFPPNTTLSQPTVVGGRIFVGSSRARVYSIDAKTGCLYWSIKAPAGVRTAMTVGPIPGTNPPRYAVYFGDLAAHAHAVDARTGEQIWTTLIDKHVAARDTGAPVLYENRLYVPLSSFEELIGSDASYQCCTFRGSVSALDAATGKVIWKTYTIAQKPKPTGKNKQGIQLWGPSGAGVWSAPTIDPLHGVLYATTGDNYSDPPSKTSDAVVALNLKTGKMLWSHQFTAKDAFNLACTPTRSTNCPESNGPDLDFGSSAILRTLPSGKHVLVAGQKSGVVHGLDPDRKGASIWNQRIGHGGIVGGIQWGPAADNDVAYTALSDLGVKFKQDPDAGTVVEFDNKEGGGIFALDLATGQRRWATPPPGCGGRPNCSPAQSAAVTGIPGVVFSGSVDGHMRAYSTQEGKVVWDFNTARDYPTKNGVPAKGGSLDGPGATVAGGMLFMGSGYGFLGGVPGNVLLGLSVDGK